MVSQGRLGHATPARARGVFAPGRPSGERPPPSGRAPQNGPPCPRSACRIRHKLSVCCLSSLVEPGPNTCNLSCIDCCHSRPQGTRAADHWSNGDSHACHSRPPGECGITLLPPWHLKARGSARLLHTHLVPRLPLIPPSMTAASASAPSAAGHRHRHDPRRRRQWS